MAPTNLISLLRVMIADDDSTAYTYTDVQLSKTIISAAILIRAEVKLENTYIVDLTAQTISPDPTIFPSTEDPDDNFTMLLLLKSACIIMQGEYRKSSKKNVIVKDGPNFFDGTKSGTAQKDVTDSFCKQYMDAKMQYANGTLVGHAVVGPFRLGYFNQLPPGWFSPRRGGW